MTSENAVWCWSLINILLWNVLSLMHLNSYRHKRALFKMKIYMLFSYPTGYLLYFCDHNQKSIRQWKVFSWGLQQNVPAWWLFFCMNELYKSFLFLVVFFVFCFLNQLDEPVNNLRRTNDERPLFVFRTSYLQDGFLIYYRPFSLAEEKTGNPNEHCK